MGYTPNSANGGIRKGTVNDTQDVLTVSRRSPNKGSIGVVLKPTDEVDVGDEIEVQANLTSPGKDLTERFGVKISEPEATKIMKFLQLQMNGLGYQSLYSFIWRHPTPLVD